MSRLSSPAGLANEPDTLNERVVRFTTAANRSLTPQDHANRVIVISAEFTNAAQTITLPPAKGTGDKYLILNNAVLTQDLVIAALGTDVFSGSAFVRSETAGSTDVFHTTATSDKYTFDNTTTGGLRGDRVELIDLAAGTWLVRIEANGSGTLATGFSQT
jgi:hypothetical protein